MLQRFTGKIVHIDFGDCFEVAMKREKFPEKVPFRLTRMLVNAMEACGIEGNYRNTCELVMRVMRENKESLLAVLEAFVYDPLIQFKLLTVSDDEGEGGQANVMPVDYTMAKSSVLQANSLTKQSDKRRMSTKILGELNVHKVQKSEREKEMQYMDEERPQPTEKLNKKAVQVIDRIKKKLVGKDFKEKETLVVEHQVKKLIDQAISHENICQAYIGWCPFW